MKENPEIYKTLEKRTKELVSKIENLIQKYEIPATVNYVNSLFTIFFAKNKIENLEDAIDTSDEMFAIYFDTMLKNGIIVPPSKYEAHFISYVHSNEDYKKFYFALEKAFEKIKNSL